ncbi:hypothetical protein RHMOL_RhmolMtG0000100 (mitochondrion) [Rhododendron molle]|nr:hypothetical protein RHMOL_RhmolMtG0005900 [Rhododendron molle]KAI8522438.1 hypothetical protein RHMOL_RhmolMtG0000100 [Rhododendron molle]
MGRIGKQKRLKQVYPFSERRKEAPEAEYGIFTLQPVPKEGRRHSHSKRRRENPRPEGVRPFPQRGRMVPVPFILLLAYVVCLADGESYPGSELDISSVSEKCLNGYPTAL